MRSLKIFSISSLIFISLFLFSGCGSLYKATGTMDAIGREYAAKIEQQTRLRNEIAQKIMEDKLSEQQLAALVAQQASLDKEIQTLRMKLEFHDRGYNRYSRYYRGYATGAGVTIDINPNTSKVKRNPADNTGQAYTITDSRVNGTITVFRLPNGYYQSGKTGRSYYRLNTLLIAEYKDVINDRNVNDVAKKLKLKE